MDDNKSSMGLDFRQSRRYLPVEVEVEDHRFLFIYLFLLEIGTGNKQHEHRSTYIQADGDVCGSNPPTLLL